MPYFSLLYRLTAGGSEWPRIDKMAPRAGFEPATNRLTDAS